jgi:nitrogen regulatory protein P-II 1
MVEIKAIVRLDLLEDVLHAIRRLPVASGVTVSRVEGFGREQPPREETGGFGRVALAKVETVVARADASTVIAAIREVASTGRPGDGKIFVLPVESVVSLRTRQDEGGGTV